MKYVDVELLACDMLVLACNHLSLPYFELPSSNALARQVSSCRLLLEIQTRLRDHLN